MSKTEALPMAEKAYSYEHLPLTPFKYEIAHHFGYNKVHWFFTKVFFSSVLPDSKFNYEQIKNNRKLPPALAIELYQAYKIEKLNGLYGK